ncbi:hypothetical protein [Rhizobium sp. NPDC090279]|uniref:hypothetical protein n=1 Tax=Rhizobium sp. NPDC090279 TaxID=3364499 RepID=UPI00383A083E
MGLDLLPEAKAKPGHEAEWRQLVQRYFNGEEFSDEIKARFAEISVPAYQTINAPRVGYDDAANRWIINTRKAQTKDEIADCLKTFHGYYAIALVGPPGIPRYSNATLGYGVDETSFRGSFLNECKSVLDEKILARAWNNMWPEEAITYGRQLLKIADAASRRAESTPSFLERLGLRKKPAPTMTEETGTPIDILRAAGEWYIFWAERGHPIRAWF